ncbi:endopeptidase La [Acinetobacter johnsonii]|uniref:Lon protease n=6 Tax=Gammaproteobacteria TaxID=1236 RepID=A0A380TTK6_ACIJO|nr:endopeptidase La [Acinetobacter johnsonii]ENU40066.1 lon protease [Acinetobacter johnsonii CIP 64.6]QPS02914.1 endopeptidase La [Acinetobacter johnsonii]SUT90992.1 DNA-binding ATP-dependent protease La [Acinetobacter johnsonii]
MSEIIMNQETLEPQVPSVLPLLALRDVVVYPHMQIALFVGREKSINAVDVARNSDNLVFVVAQKDSLSEEIDHDNLYQYGTVAKIVQVVNHENDENCIKVLIEGLHRSKLEKIIDENDYLTAEHALSPMSVHIDETTQETRVQELRALFAQYAEAKLRNARELVAAANKIDDLLQLLFFVATRVPLNIDVKQKFLEHDEFEAHLQELMTYLLQQSEEQQIEQTLHDSVKRQMEKNQREYFLNEKMKVIQRELSDMNGGAEDDVAEIEKRLAEADLPEHVRKKAESEFRKLKAMQPASSEAAVVRNYIEAILDTPWNKASKVSINLSKAQEILDADHYGLDDVKDRIVEYLAVQSRVKKLKGPILCLVGPPGVGKTSLGESVAKATGREFVRMALGGVRDEAEIRGHRRTYIGAMPGKIVQSLTKVGVKNPLFLLDEIDKMAQDYRGDPASALLEVLDPSQNSKFNDHYLDLDLDLSEVMFICTANSMNIPEALLDRMEVIRLPGYTEDEKVNIAERYLVPKAMKNNGLRAKELTVHEEAIRDIVQRYTREAGVRSLEREVSKIARKVVKEAVSKKAKNLQVDVTSANLPDYLGPHKFDFGMAEDEAQVGRVNGLAWTSVGGELLTIEVAAVKGKGKGKFITTGSLGDVMKESITAAMTVVRTRADELGIESTRFEETDVHVHLPEGATPKDGPSAGLALTTALVSAFTGIPIRPDIAMTGETSLGGRAMRIGGLKEKLLAAHRGGIKLVFIPQDNVRDLSEIPDNVKEGLEIKAVKSIDEILPLALTSMPEPLVKAPIVKAVDEGKKAARH